MAIRTMIAPIFGGSEEHDMHFAIRLAQVLTAHLDAVFVRPDPDEAFAYAGFFPDDTDGATRELQDRIERQGRATADRIRRRFGAACRKAGLPMVRKPERQGRATVAWHGATGDPALRVPEIARSADLTVFAASGDGTGARFDGVLEATLLRSGHPVLYAPDAGAEPAYSPALVAWDGGSACVRALSAWLAAGPGTGPARVLHVSDMAGEAPDLGGPLTHLAWHGIAAEAEVRPRGSDSVGGALLAAAADFGARLIVMGGYGHLRLREAMFGGVTRHVIRHARIPVLMMH